MTITEAKRILKSPKFGDPDCIQAKRVLDDEQEAVSLRKLLLGKQVECWCCEGRRYLRCACGCEDKYHPCHTCRAEKKLELTEQILKDLVLYQLQDIAKELHLR